jgi:hypothetical protein
VWKSPRFASLSSSFLPTLTLPTLLLGLSRTRRFAFLLSILSVAGDQIQQTVAALLGREGGFAFADL